MRIFLNDIRQKPEDHRRKVAFGLSIALTLVITLGWAAERGFLHTSSGTVAESDLQGELRSSSQTATVATALTPLESSKQTFKAILGEFGTAYSSFKESMSSVLVPFVSGIEIYEKK